MNIFFMRHGETSWNTVKRLQGTTDIPLNQNGIELAKKTAAGMYQQGITFQRIYSSPLIRAKQTAEQMNAFSNIEIIEDSRISEFCFGKGEGVLFKDIIEDPKYAKLKAWFKDPEHYEPFEGSESFQHFFGRISSFLDDIKLLEKQDKKIQNVLIVCHGGVTRGILKVMLDLSIKHFAELQIPNCSINCATLNEGTFQIQYTAKVFQ